MLELALKSELPLIKIITDDTVNVGDVLSYIVDESVMLIDESHIPKLSKETFEPETRYFYLLDAKEINYPDIYEKMVNCDRTLIMVNPLDTSTLMFDAGVLHLPNGMLKDFLGGLVTKKSVKPLVATLSGLCLKDVGEICRLAQTQFKELTPRAVMETRRIYVGRMQGVQQVSTKYDYYKPPAFLKKWLSVDGKIFVDYTVQDSLIPRGLLFDGIPGGGKTLGSKYLADELGIPLYRIDLGALMGKYVGESEENLAQALSVIDNCQPCVLLFDEIEKSITSQDDSGVSSRMLSAVLWWLQEHDSRVLTIMTTNNAAILPIELYRSGRIDEVFEFKGITNHDAATELIIGVLESLGYKDDPKNKTQLAYCSIWENIEEVNKFRTTETDNEEVIYSPPVSHADLTSMVYKAVKQHIVNI